MSEIEMQNEIFQQIMKVCDGQPTERVLQVLAETLACTVVATQAMTLEQVVEFVRAAYDAALPASAN